MREITQLTMDMKFASRREKRAATDRRIVKRCVEVAAMLELVRDELRCRELMKTATSDEVVIALDNLRLVLRDTRKLLASH